MLKENLAIYVPEFNFNDVVAKMRKPSNAKHKKALKKVVERFKSFDVVVM